MIFVIKLELLEAFDIVPFCKKENKSLLMSLHILSASTMLQNTAEQ